MNTIEHSQAQPEVDHSPSFIHSSLDETSMLKGIIELLIIDSTIAQPDLLSMALTCKAFRDPALDVLWESLDSLMPLLRLLSPFKLVNGLYVFQGPFDEKDWERFDAYACRVKKLTGLQDYCDVAQSTYLRLAQLRSCILPALEEFNSPSIDEGNTNLLISLPPTLKRLTIGGSRGVFDKLIGPALSMIAYGPEQVNLNLTHLTLCGQSPIHPPGLLPHFLNLRHLDISGVIDAQNLSEMGELGHLESMIVQLPDSLVLANKALGFGQLRSLHITSSFPSILSVLEKMATTTLESIRIISVPIAESFPEPSPETKQKTLKAKRLGRDVPPPEAPNYWREIIEIIHSRWSLALRSLIIDQDEPPHITFNPTPSNLFSGLSPFQRLECFKVQRCKFFPCDEGIRFLASACPNIMTLHLPMECVVLDASPSVAKTDQDVVEPSRPGTSTTIVALWSLCDLCQKLEDLQISLDITHIPRFLNTTIRSHHLVQLSVSSHPDTVAGQSHVLDIARHIDRLFPYLENVISHPSYGANIWDQVRRILSVYKMVRWDDRERRTASGDVSTGITPCC